MPWQRESPTIIRLQAANVQQAVVRRLDKVFVQRADLQDVAAARSRGLILGVALYIMPTVETGGGMGATWSPAGQLIIDQSLTKASSRFTQNTRHVAGASSAGHACLCPSAWPGRQGTAASAADSQCSATGLFQTCSLSSLCR